jgi:glutamate transport system permease protein
MDLWDLLKDVGPSFPPAFLATLELVLISSAIGLVLGTVLAVMRIAPVGLLRGIGTVYVSILRNTPAIVVLYMTVFVLPLLGVSAPFFVLASIGLTIYYAAFFCEAIRSGVNSIPTGQFEAARSLGLTGGQVVTQVLVPQAVRVVIPPLINVFIAVTRTSAVAGAFGVAELLANLSRLSFAHGAEIMQILALTGLCYLAINIPAGLIAARIERKVRFAR